MVSGTGSGSLPAQDVRLAAPFTASTGLGESQRFGAGADMNASSTQSQRSGSCTRPQCALGRATGSARRHVPSSMRHTAWGPQASCPLLIQAAALCGFLLLF